MTCSRGTGHALVCQSVIFLLSRHDIVVDCNVNSLMLVEIKCICIVVVVETNSTNVDWDVGKIKREGKPRVGSDTSTSVNGDTINDCAFVPCISTPRQTSVSWQLHAV
jgi:hypothetical protein